MRRGASPASGQASRSLDAADASADSGEKQGRGGSATAGGGLPLRPRATRAGSSRHSSSSSIAGHPGAPAPPSHFRSGQASDATPAPAGGTRRGTRLRAAEDPEEGLAAQGRPAAGAPQEERWWRGLSARRRGTGPPTLEGIQAADSWTHLEYLLVNAAEQSRATHPQLIALLCSGAAKSTAKAALARAAAAERQRAHSTGALLVPGPALWPLPTSAAMRIARGGEHEPVVGSEEPGKQQLPAADALALQVAYRVADHGAAAVQRAAAPLGLRSELLIQREQGIAGFADGHHGDGEGGGGKGAGRAWHQVPGRLVRGLRSLLLRLTPTLGASQLAAVLACLGATGLVTEVGKEARAALMLRAEQVLAGGAQALLCGQRGQQLQPGRGGSWRSVESRLNAEVGGGAVDDIDGFLRAGEATADGGGDSSGPYLAEAAAAAAGAAEPPKEEGRGEGAGALTVGEALALLLLVPLTLGMALGDRRRDGVCVSRYIWPHFRQAVLQPDLPPVAMAALACVAPRLRLVMADTDVEEVLLLRLQASRGVEAAQPGAVEGGGLPAGWELVS